MYFRPLVTLAIALLLATLLAWTKHRRYEFTHILLAMVSVVAIVTLSIWCGGPE